MSNRATDIAAMLTPSVEALQLELLGVELAASGAHALLRLYIDAPGRIVAIEDCEAVSREVSEAGPNSFRYERVPRMISFGFSTFPVFDAGQCSVQRPHSTQL